MATVVNKAGIQPITCDRYTITASQVVKYLQDQLGFNIGYDFTRWVGVSTNNSYVRMRVVFNPKDIIADSNSTDYVDKINNLDYNQRSIIKVLSVYICIQN